jgi:hypothetical protein
MTIEHSSKITQMRALWVARSHYFATSKPTRLTIYEDHVELLTVNGPVKRDDQRVRYEQVAQVCVREGWVFSELVIETRGGGLLQAVGLRHAQANEARQIIEERLEH